MYRLLFLLFISPPALLAPYLTAEGMCNYCEVFLTGPHLTYNFQWQAKIRSRLLEEFNIEIGGGLGELSGKVMG